MTAEIAILNRSAVALAADSAVTIRFGDTEKIYNSAEKIFEFSRLSPIGLMINNSVDYMGIPWDVLARRHRTLFDQVYSKVADAADAFLTYLVQLPVSTAHEDSHLQQLLSEAYSELLDTYLTETARIQYNPPDDLKMEVEGVQGFNARALFHKLVAELTSKHGQFPLEGYLADKSVDDFSARYGGVSDQVARVVFEDFPLGDEEFKLLHQMALFLIRSQAPSITSTGLIFAGYAEDDFFPSIVVHEVDGRYFGELKAWRVGQREVDRGNSRAIILPFAQREMVDRFMYGVDADFEKVVGSHFEEASKTIADQVTEFISRSEGEHPAIPAGFAESISQTVVDNFKNVVMNNIKSLYLRDVYDMVTAMPKAELAQMAESLVSLTSIKRRMSAQSETVGGPVDVALITRGEGFIWINRKHYFDRDKNPGFFSRHYIDY